MADQWVLQLCHGYSGPFLDVARQYAVLFCDTPYKVLTVYLTGEPQPHVLAGSASDEVIFLNYASRDIRGLKLTAIARLKSIVSRRKFAFIIAHRPKPIYIACLATRLPVIGVHHGFGDYERPQRRWFAHCFRQRLALLGVSDAVRDEIRAHLAWPAERIETLHNRLDVAHVRAQLVPRDEARQALGLPAGAVVIANVGRLHPDKDQATLLKGFAAAWPKLPPESLLVIIGSGPLEEKLKQLAAQLGVTAAVCFLGQVADARRYFRAFDLFVLSSDHEPFGMVLLEAMAADVPVLATDCGGAPEVIAYPEQLFPLRDEARLADRLVDLFAGQDSTYRDMLARQGSQRLLAHFTDEAARQCFWEKRMLRQH